MPSKSLQTIYYALIYPYFTYCNLIWASTYVTNLQRIYLLQKRAVRAISKVDYKASSKSLFANLKILDVFTIYSLQVSTYMIMMLYLFLLLKSFKLETRFINIQHDTLTFTDLIPVEQILKKIPILFQGPRIWNSLPNDIKNAPSFSIFKRVIKSFLTASKHSLRSYLFIYYFATNNELQAE